MKVQKMLVVMMLGLMLIPSITFAQTVPVPTRDELVRQLIASLMEQVKALQAQLVILQKNATSTATTTPIAATSTANYGKPYLATDGNWYYPNAYDTNGKKLKAPIPVSAKLVSISSDNTTQINLGVTPKTSPTEYSAVPALTFEIIGKNDSFDLRKLIAHINIDGTAQIINAYLYQGDKTPIASAVVTKNVASFDIPKGTTGATIAPNLPTEYTIKVAVTGLKETQLNLPKCQGTYFNGSLDNVAPGYRPISSSPTTAPVTSPASFKINLDAKNDIQLYDSAGNLIPVSGVVEKTVQISIYQSISNLCYAPGWREA